MSNNEFVIENGILKQYIGKGGDVVIPDGVTEIGFDIFRFNTIVKSLSIPDSVKFIQPLAFLSLNGVETIITGQDKTELADVEGITNILIAADAVLLDYIRHERVTPKSLDSTRRFLENIGKSRNLYAIWTTYDKGVEEALEKYGLKSYFKKCFICDSFEKDFGRDIMTRDYYFNVLQKGIDECSGSSYTDVIFVSDYEGLYKNGCFYEIIHYDPHKMIGWELSSGWVVHNYDEALKAFNYYDSQWKVNKLLKKRMR